MLQELCVVGDRFLKHKDIMDLILMLNQIQMETLVQMYYHGIMNWSSISFRLRMVVVGHLLECV